MAVLVPLVFLVVSFLAVMVMLLRNLQRLDSEAGEAWRRVQEIRMQRLDAWSGLASGTLAAAACDESQTSCLERKIGACRQADGPAEACEADSLLAGEWQDLTAKVDLRAVYAQPAALEAIDFLHATDDTALALERLYNNAATLYNNAGVTFPALLVAKRAHFAARQLYRPQRMRRLPKSDNAADRESLAEKSPHIMNAYMLWAIGMSDMTMEEVSSDGEHPLA
ncbi:MAG: hypothetical protein RSN88_07215 [Gordonibacter sp.]|uniref:hypothetical protein n=1 Tax=Gordonibacter sp. TaxID=1968902 RepID=UPI002FC8A064